MPTAAAMTLLWHVTMVYEHHGQICQNGFYFTNRDPISDDPSVLGPYTQGICADFNTYAMPTIKAFHSQQVHYKTLICSTLIPHNGPIGELIFESMTGDQAGESLPSYSAAVLTLRTGFGGKSNRGRLYFGGISEDDHADSRLLADSFTALQNIGDNLLGAFGPTGIEAVLRWVMFSKRHGLSENIWRAEGIRPITHTIARRDLRTCRHRMLGKGT